MRRLRDTAYALVAIFFLVLAAFLYVNAKSHTTSYGYMPFTQDR